MKITKRILASSGSQDGKYSVVDTHFGWVVMTGGKRVSPEFATPEEAYEHIKTLEDKDDDYIKSSESFDFDGLVESIKDKFVENGLEDNVSSEGGKITLTIVGDWKNDHSYAKQLIQEVLDDMDLSTTFKVTTSDSDYTTDSDYYRAKYTIQPIESCSITSCNKNVNASYDPDWDDEESSGDDFECIDSKYVRDSDGFLTEYSMYYDKVNDQYVFVFGDSDLYRPEDSDYDYECDTLDEAREWFDSYKGFEDKDEDDLF